MFEKNVEKAYRSVERAPRAGSRLATAIERVDNRSFATVGAVSGAVFSSVMGYPHLEPLSSGGGALVFVLLVGVCAFFCFVLANVLKCAAWHLSESNTADPGKLKDVLKSVSGDPRLEAVVQHWIDERKARCVLQTDVEHLARTTERLEELRKDEARRLEGLQALDLQLNCVSRYHAGVRQETLQARLPTPESPPPVSSRL